MSSIGPLSNIQPNIASAGTGSTPAAGPGPQAAGGSPASAVTAGAAASAAGPAGSTRKPRAAKAVGDVANASDKETKGGAPIAKMTGVQYALDNSLKIPSYTPSPGQAASAGSWGTQRGYIQSSIRAFDDGWMVKVDTHHTAPGDKVNLFVSLRVVDPPEEHFFILSTPFHGPMPGDGKDAAGMCVSSKEFFVSAKDINAFLAKRFGKKADGSPKLQFKPGSDPLFIDAVWQDIGHQAGGRRDQTQGYLLTPPLAGKTSALDIKNGKVPVAVAATESIGRAADKAVEYTFAIPQAVIDKYPLVFSKNAKLVVRREHELKIDPNTFDDLKTFTLKLMDIAKMSKAEQDKALVDVFGSKGWQLAITDRYYKKEKVNGVEQVVVYKAGELVWNVKDAAGEHPFDFAGLPKVAGMYDNYQDRIAHPRAATDQYYRSGYYADQSKFIVSKLDGAVRFRDGEIKAGENSPTVGKLNIKPGGGVYDPITGVGTRLEFGLDTKPGIVNDAKALEQLKQFLDNEFAPLNPMMEFKTLNSELGGDVIATNIVDVSAQRYKFTAHSSTGLEKEMSCDFVMGILKHASPEPTATKGKTADEKYDHWVQQFTAVGATVDGSAGKVSKGAFYDATTKENFYVEISKDAAGKKTVREFQCVFFKQLENEMDHVQLTTTSAAQTLIPTGSKSGTNAQTKSDEDKIVAKLSDNATLSAPATVHQLQDLKDPSVYSTGSYAEMAAAAKPLLKWGFPNGFTRARQKAAMAMQLFGLIPKRNADNVSIEFPLGVYPQGANISGYSQQVNISGTQLTNGKPMDFYLRIGDFPLTVKLDGNETVDQIADKVAMAIDTCLFYKAQINKTQYSTNVNLVAK